TAPGRAPREVCRTQETPLARRESECFALVPDMVAGRDHVCAGIQRGEENLLGDAETACGVLAVDDDKIQSKVGNQAGKLFPYRHTARLADHVTQKEKSHEGPRKLHDFRDVTRPRSDFSQS